MSNQLTTYPTKPLEQLLSRFEGDKVNGSEHLTIVGVDDIADAFLNGHTMNDICRYLNVTLRSFQYWQSNLSADEKAMLQDAKIKHLEDMEAYLSGRIADIAKPADTPSPDDPSIDDVLLIRAKHIHNIEKALKATQATLNRLKAQAEPVADESEKIINKLIISEEALSYLPK